MKTLLLAGAALASAMALCMPASAAVIDVTDTVTGSAGAWVHNFTVTNNLPNTNDIYFFGVNLGPPSLLASPANFVNWGSGWNNSSYGGSATVYNTAWIDNSFSGLLPGQTLSGFTATDSNAVALTNVSWFAYAYKGNYSGPECFYCGLNPGFENVAQSVGTGVPEPATWALMISGFGLAGAALRRRRTMVAA